MVVILIAVRTTIQSAQIDPVGWGYRIHRLHLYTNRPGDQGSIPGKVIAKTQKIVLDAALLNTQHYKVRIKGKVEQPRK